MYIFFIKKEILRECTKLPESPCHHYIISSVRSTDKPAAEKISLKNSDPVYEANNVWRMQVVKNSVLYSLHQAPFFSPAFQPLSMLSYALFTLLVCCAGSLPKIMLFILPCFHLRIALLKIVSWCVAKTICRGSTELYMFYIYFYKNCIVNLFSNYHWIILHLLFELQHWHKKLTCETLL